MSKYEVRISPKLGHTKFENFPAASIALAYVLWAKSISSIGTIIQVFCKNELVFKTAGSQELQVKKVDQELNIPYLRKL